MDARENGSDVTTLVTTEAAWQPAIGALSTTCALGSLALLAVTLPHAWPVPWLPLALSSLVLHGSNLHFLRANGHTTVGMGPVALFGLLPAATCAALCPQLPALLVEASHVVAMLLTVLVAVFALWFQRLRAAARPQAPISPTAALIVLGGAIRNGRPCRTLAARLDAAVRLWHEEPGRLIVLTGGPTPEGSTEAAEMACYLTKQGMATASLLLEPTARNTRENVERSCELLDACAFSGQRCVVSSDYHLLRALREARQVGATLVPVAAPTPPGTALQQWCREVLTILAGR